MSMRVLQAIFTPVVVLFGWLAVLGATSASPVRHHPPVVTAAGAGEREPDIFEDWRKFVLVVFGTAAGSYICLALRVEKDAEFARTSSLNRRISFAVVSFMWGVCTTPQALMYLTPTPPLALCPAVSVINGILSWVCLELVWSFGPKLVRAFLGKFVKIPDDPQLRDDKEDGTIPPHQ
jgi:hypothetical protein